MLVKMWRNKRSHTVDRDVKWCSHFGKTSQVPQNVTIRSGIFTAGYIPKKKENVFPHKLAHKCLQQRYAWLQEVGTSQMSISTWVSLRCTHEFEPCSEIQRNELLIHSWMNQENIMLIKEASHKIPYVVRLYLNEMFRTGRPRETEKRWAFAEGCREWGKPGTGFLSELMKMFQNCVDGYIIWGLKQKPLHCIQVSLMV